MSEIYWIIIAGGILTYLTRIGGHLIFTRFEHIHPRLEAGLNAVPAAVLTTLFAPAVLNAGPAEFAALAIAAFITLTVGNFTLMFLLSAFVLIVLRQLIG